MARNKRRDRMWAEERAAFVKKATDLHQEIAWTSSRLTYGGPDHAAIQRLHEAIIAAIREVTGEDPPWMQPTPALKIGIPGSGQ